MDIQQAIEKIAISYKAAVEQYHKAIGKRFYKAASAWRQDVDALEMALTALREKAARENPEPLTMEELRQMDGEPVWVALSDGERAEWCVMEFGCALVPGVEDTWHEAKEYGKEWTAYRHKPKEESA